MSRQRTVTQIGAKAMRLLAGFVARGHLRRPAEAELAEVRSGRKRRNWHLSAATYRRLGEKGQGTIVTMGSDLGGSATAEGLAFDVVVIHA